MITLQPNLPPLDLNRVIVLRVCLDEAPREVCLDEQEQRQAERFVFDRDRRRYIAAHTAMRVLLGRYLDVSPLDVQFAAGSRGKPRLVDPPCDLRFNLSHSEERALLAITLGREVGVDIEYVRPVPDMVGVAASVFSQIERVCLEATPIDQQADVFFRVWTRKESFIKALGDGMHFPLTGFDVSIDTSLPQLLLTCTAAPAEIDRWTMQALACDEGYKAAITVEGSGFEIVSTAL